MELLDPPKQDYIFPESRRAYAIDCLRQIRLAVSPAFAAHPFNNNLLAALTARFYHNSKLAIQGNYSEKLDIGHQS